MKKPKIRNPIQRWFAGLGAFVVIIAAGGSALVAIGYVFGRLTQPFWAETSAFDWLYPYNSMYISVIGMGELVIIGLACVIGWGIYEGAQWTGNYFFNSLVPKLKAQAY